MNVWPLIYSTKTEQTTHLDPVTRIVKELELQREGKANLACSTMCFNTDTQTKTKFELEYRVEYFTWNKPTRQNFYSRILLITHSSLTKKNTILHERTYLDKKKYKITFWFRYFDFVVTPQKAIKKCLEIAPCTVLISKSGVKHFKKFFASLVFLDLAAIIKTIFRYSTLSLSIVIRTRKNSVLCILVKQFELCPVLIESTNLPNFQFILYYNNHCICFVTLDWDKPMYSLEFIRIYQIIPFDQYLIFCFSFSFAILFFMFLWIRSDTASFTWC